MTISSPRVVRSHQRAGSLPVDVGVVVQRPRLPADPRLPLRDLVAEPLRAAGRRKEADAAVAELARGAGPGVDPLTRVQGEPRAVRHEAVVTEEDEPGDNSPPPQGSCPAAADRAINV
ncbi:hypothetical protein ACGFX2_08140 [Streptomyces goshikiensis]|uniref:hypothetical protein n=1 Tax=Streptomyces goshikiensis TaxID=1942 RepID=UPI003713B568